MRIVQTCWWHPLLINASRKNSNVESSVTFSAWMDLLSLSYCPPVIGFEARLGVYPVFLAHLL